MSSLHVQLWLHITIRFSFLHLLFAYLQDVTCTVYIQLTMEVVTVDPIEVMFLPRDYVVPQVHGSPCDRAVKVAMGRRLAE